MPSGVTNQTGDPDATADNSHALTLQAGETFLSADFGYNWAPAKATDSPVAGEKGALGDTVWIDSDADGVQDPGELRLGGVAVTLYADNDGDGVYSDVVGTTTTDAAGRYIFDDITPGAYVVAVTPPAGYTPTADFDGILDNRTSPLLIGPGDVFVDADFGYRPDGSDPTLQNSIGDTIFLDVDGDGLEDAGEPGIAGVTVALLDAAGDVIATTMTDAGGHYLFSDVPAGSYQVWVNDVGHVLTDLTPTGDADQDGGATPNRSDVTVGSAEAITTQDFGYLPAGHTGGAGLIGDTIFFDLDGDATPDSGEGLEGVVVYLLNSGGAIVDSAITDAYGRYVFGELADGDYTVRVDATTLPVGLTNTVDPDGGTAGESAVTISGGNADFDQDFGYEAAVPGSISGTIWLDGDADGVLNETGTGLAGVTVNLLDEQGRIIATATTDGNGDYIFDGLPPGIYAVDVVDENNLLDGYWSSPNGPGAGDNRTDDNSQSDGYAITLGRGEDHVLADFGFFSEPGDLGDRIFYDLNADGIQDAGEPGIAGVVVTLTVTYPTGDVVIMVTTSAADGSYSFENLLLDEDLDGIGATEPTFIVTVAPPAEYQTSPLDAASDDSDADDPDGEVGTPTQGTNDDSNDFGFYGLDFGDLPDSYDTTSGSGGAQHVIYPAGVTGRLYLGTAAPDAESNGPASGDGTDDGADEDGVARTDGQWVPGNTVTITVDVAGASGALGAWLDWDGNGSFEADEFIDFGTLPAGANVLNLAVPNDGSYTAGTPVSARFRLFDPAAVPGGTLDAVDFGGLAVNGEVEDYRWFFSPTAITLQGFAVGNGGGVPAAQLLLLSMLVAMSAVWIRRRQSDR